MMLLASQFVTFKALILGLLAVAAYFGVSLVTIGVSFVVGFKNGVSGPTMLIGMFLGMFAAVTFRWWLFLPGMAAGTFVACVVGIIHVRYLE